MDGEHANAMAVVFDTSSTAKENLTEMGFSASDADESDATGKWFTDVFKLEGVALPTLSMGLADDAQRFLGTFGLGFNNSKIDGVVDAMTRQGLIASGGYSIWPDDESQS